MCPLYGGRLWFKCSCGTWKKCPLYGVSALEKFCYKGFLRNSSRTKFFARLREVSTLEDVRFREVPLYILVTYGWHKRTDEWHTNDIRVQTSGIRVTYEYIRVTYEWYTSDIRVHTVGIRVIYERHTSDMRKT